VVSCTSKGNYASETLGVIRILTGKYVVMLTNSAVKKWHYCIVFLQIKFIAGKQPEKLSSIQKDSQWYYLYKKLFA